MFNRKHSDEVIEKIKINRSKGIDQEKMNKLSSENNSKCVLQFDLEGNFIQEFSSVREASKILNISQGEVGSSCRGDRISKKFIFKYKYEKDLVMNNSYVYKIGDNININDIEYKLVRRTKVSCIFELDNDYISFKKKEYDWLWNKNII